MLRSPVSKTFSRRRPQAVELPAEEVIDVDGDSPQEHRRSSQQPGFDLDMHAGGHYEDAEDESRPSNAHPDPGQGPRNRSELPPSPANAWSETFDAVGGPSIAHADTMANSLQICQSFWGRTLPFATLVLCILIMYLLWQVNRQGRSEECDESAAYCAEDANVDGRGENAPLAEGNALVALRTVYASPTAPAREALEPAPPKQSHFFTDQLPAQSATILDAAEEQAAHSKPFIDRSGPRKKQKVKESGDGEPQQADNMTGSVQQVDYPLELGASARSAAHSGDAVGVNAGKRRPEARFGKLSAACRPLLSASWPPRAHCSHRLMLPADRSPAGSSYFSASSNEAVDCEALNDDELASKLPSVGSPESLAVMTGEQRAEAIRRALQAQRGADFRSKLGAKQQQISKQKAEAASGPPTPQSSVLLRCQPPVFVKPLYPHIMSCASVTTRLLHYYTAGNRIKGCILG